MIIAEYTKIDLDVMAKDYFKEFKSRYRENGEGSISKDVAMYRGDKYACRLFNTLCYSAIKHKSSNITIEME